MTTSVDEILIEDTSSCVDDHLTRTEGKILIVDDDQIVRKIISVILSRVGYGTSQANDGPQALSMLESDCPDVILLDYRMPGMDGLEVCKSIRANDKFKDIPIVFLTSNNEITFLGEAFEAGASDFLGKPVNSIELLARINTQMKIANSTRDLRQQANRLEDVVDDQMGRLGQIKDGQERLMVDPADYPDLKVAVAFQAALEAGGDFYDIVKLSEECYGFMIADVAGHDLGTAYITGALKSLTVSFTNEVLTVGETFMMLNNSLYRFLEECQYATAAYMKYVKSTKIVEIVNAGHPNPIIQHADGRVEVLDMSGDVLGMYDTIMCDSLSFKVDPGDRMYLFTDGLVESYRDKNGELGSRDVGNEWVMNQLMVLTGKTVQESVDAIIKDVMAHNGGTLDDDIILMGIEFD